MIDINLTIVIQVVQFLLLLFILNRFLFRPTINLIEEREQKITTWKEETKNFHESMQERLQSYENQILEAKAQAQEQQELVTVELQKEEDKKLEAVSEEAVRIVVSTREKLQEETELLRGQLREQAEEMSQLVAEKVLGRKA
ncbi:MAG: ATP synthase F0 subunit B [Deltaproteobacteria bacterium]|jgi:F-type H+-transporting ATPase subunit b|nr:ATP synthase F0 subunit B [Deltaproteobacteria bacterium]